MRSRSVRIAVLGAALAALLGAAPADAGDKAYQCPLDTQTCLNRMVAKLKKGGWLGIYYENRESGGPVVTKIVPGSPAETAGFLVGDVLVSVNGAKFSENSDERCATCDRTKDVWKPGGKVDYVVRRGDRDVAVSATLASMPPDMLAMMVGMHMIEHARPE